MEHAKAAVRAFAPLSPRKKTLQTTEDALSRAGEKRAPTPHALQPGQRSERRSSVCGVIPRARQRPHPRPTASLRAAPWSAFFRPRCRCPPVKLRHRQLASLFSVSLERFQLFDVDGCPWICGLTSTGCTACAASCDLPFNFFRRVPREPSFWAAEFSSPRLAQLFACFSWT